MDLYRKVPLACAEGMSQREAARHFSISRTLRPNPYYLRNAMFKFTDIQVERMLTEEEVKEINYITKMSAHRYIAAADSDWLYPEESLASTNWRTFGDGYAAVESSRFAIDRIRELQVLSKSERRSSQGGFGCSCAKIGPRPASAILDMLADCRAMALLPSGRRTANGKSVSYQQGDGTLTCGIVPPAVVQRTGLRPIHSWHPRTCA